MQFQVFRQAISDSLTRERLLAALTGFFGVLAALLASIGLYGVLAYQTVSRRGEIGIRFNRLTGSVDEARDGSLVVLPGVHELRIF